MHSMTPFLLSVFLTFLFISGEAKLPDITPEKTVKLAQQIMEEHASEHKLTPDLMKRIFNTYLEELDPTKTYLIESDIDQWVNPSQPLLQQTIAQYNKGDFTQFSLMLEQMKHTIDRRHAIDKEITSLPLPPKVDPKQFKEMKWTKNPEELKERILNIKALQIQSSTKLNDEVKEKALQRIAKRQAKLEDEILNTNTKERQKLILTKVLKATTSALDTHTHYFTPEEAKQFMIDVQQRLFGIGAQLRDDLSGFTVVKIVEGGPAERGGELKAKDRIIAVNHEPVVGMDIEDAVQLIRGEENTPALLTVIREEGEGNNKEEKKIDLTVIRGEVVLKEARIEASYEPCGDGVIAYIKLHSFYQDPEHSSSTDLEAEFDRIKAEHRIKGVVLDLRYNSGGLLNQAVAVAGLFIKKGIVVTIKDNSGQVQHLRDLDSKMMWDGPLVVLINRASASASEIVAQALQDYGRAIIVGDDHSFGKGSFQTFTLNSQNGEVNPNGEYKVTRGRYYTVSGKTPQLVGVQSDVVIPGILSESEIGEKFAKYPLENEVIKENFNDDLSDIPYMQREKFRSLYKFDLQKPTDQYTSHLSRLKSNSTHRVEHNKDYQSFLKLIKSEEPVDPEQEESHGQNDLQLNETMNVIKDLVLLAPPQ